MAKETKPAIFVLDGGVLIALATGEKRTEDLAQEIAAGNSLFACTELAMSELAYIICRKAGWETASKKIKSLIKSATIQTIPASSLWQLSAQLKCKAAIALPDCFTIAAAQILKGAALFVRKEKELKKALDHRLVPNILQFL
jgi:uncharacterized protein with PIN domain